MEWTDKEKCKMLFNVFSDGAASTSQQPQLKPYHLENQTILNRNLQNLDFKCFQISNGDISDLHCIDFCTKDGILIFFK